MLGSNQQKVVKKSILWRRMKASLAVCYSTDHQLEEKYF